MEYVTSSTITATVDDVDEMIAVIIFAVLIVIFALVALFFLVMIIRLKREQRYRYGNSITRHVRPLPCIFVFYYREVSDSRYVNI